VAILRSEIEEKVKNSLPHLKKEFKVRSIGIFGSVAKNTNTQKSDVDILVELGKGHKDFFNYLHLKEYLETLLDANVDLVIKEAVKPALKEIILREVRYV
jgi:uncharacterized protein